MRRISFALTTEQFLDGSKDVTRRAGWKSLQPGTLLLAVDKVMGFPKGHRGGGRKLGVIEVVSVRREPLSAITQDDVRREGFPGWTPQEFVEFFCKKMRCGQFDGVTRIEFKRVDQ